MAWDVHGEGYDCAACDDETRVLRYCTKPLKRPAAWEEYRTGDYKPGKPPAPEDLCAVLRVPWWARTVVRDVPLYRNGGPELLQEREWWFDLVSHASMLCHKKEAELLERSKKDKGGDAPWK